MKSTASQYGGMAVALHWITVLLIAAMIVSGMLMEEARIDTQKLWLLRLHAVSGITLLSLTIIRIIWWLALDKRPQPVAGAGQLANLAAKAVHSLFYVLILALSISGYGILATSGADAIILGNLVAPLPDFWLFAPRAPHAIVSKAMIALAVLHIAAAIYHQIVKRDGMLRRMWFTGRASGV